MLAGALLLAAGALLLRWCIDDLMLILLCYLCSWDNFENFNVDDVDC